MGGSGNVGNNAQQQVQVTQNQSPMLMTNMKQQSPAMNQLIQQHPMSNNPLSNNPPIIAPNTPQQQIYQQHLQPGYFKCFNITCIVLNFFITYLIFNWDDIPNESIININFPVLNDKNTVMLIF